MRDILSGALPAGSRLPSKRSLAENLGISSITVEAAYNRLMDGGLASSVPRSGYYVEEVPLRRLSSGMSGTQDRGFGVAGSDMGSGESGREEASEGGTGKTGRDGNRKEPGPEDVQVLDLSGSRAPAERFPFTVWTRLLRSTVNDLGPELLQPSPGGGVYPLREAIARHLRSFRGMEADPGCIIVGAGTEYLYGLLIQLLGRERIYCLEDPGYRKPAQIYRAAGAECRWAPLDGNGLTVPGLEASGADVAHISPTHHFPTGITMPVSRRLELLRWAAAKENRYILEDDYDSEFRLTGRPVPSLQSIDRDGRVIYLNTFSKTLASTVRISYMVLPPALAAEFFERLRFYSCTVSTFEQYTLAKFISEGYFEKHLNRMRRHYARVRKELLRQIAEAPAAGRIRVLERDSGLHFLLQLDTGRSDGELSAALLEEGIRLNPLSSYYLNPSEAPEHTFLLSYSDLSPEDLGRALPVLSRLL